MVEEKICDERESCAVLADIDSVVFESGRLVRADRLRNDLCEEFQLSIDIDNRGELGSIFFVQGHEDDLVHFRENKRVLV